jgi:hypothetical protein
MIKKINVNIREMVYNFPTKSEYGLTDEELNKLLTWFPTINKDKVDDALMGNTCMMFNDEIVNYHHDVLKALQCGFENRSLTLAEWD